MQRHVLGAFVLRQGPEYVELSSSETERLPFPPSRRASSMQRPAPPRASNQRAGGRMLEVR